MKKLFFGVIAMVMFTTFANANEKSEILNLTENGNYCKSDKVRVVITIDWGRKSQNCLSGFGICDVDITVEIDVDLTNIHFRGGADDKGRFLLEITSQGMNSIKTYFGSTTIVIEEDFRISDEDCRSLGLRTGYTIRAGKYTPIKDSTGQYTVLF